MAGSAKLGKTNATVGPDQRISEVPEWWFEISTAQAVGVDEGDLAA
jgi:hypothetical protein